MTFVPVSSLMQFKRDGAAIFCVECDQPALRSPYGVQCPKCHKNITWSEMTQQSIQDHEERVKALKLPNCKPTDPERIKPGSVWFDEKGLISDGAPATYIVLSGLQNISGETASWTFTVAKFRAFKYGWMGAPIGTKQTQDFDRLKLIGEMPLSHMRAYWAKLEREKKSTKAAT